MTGEPASCEFTRFQNQNGGEIEMGDNDINSMKEEKYEEPSSIGKYNYRWCGRGVGADLPSICKMVTFFYVLGC